MSLNVDYYWLFVLFFFPVFNFPLSVYSARKTNVCSGIPISSVFTADTWVGGQIRNKQLWPLTWPRFCVAFTQKYERGFGAARNFVFVTSTLFSKFPLCSRNLKTRKTRPSSSSVLECRVAVQFIHVGWIKKMTWSFSPDRKAATHDFEIQHLYEEMEQQIKKEKDKIVLQVRFWRYYTILYYLNIVSGPTKLKKKLKKRSC